MLIQRLRRLIWFPFQYVATDYGQANGPTSVGDHLIASITYMVPEYTNMNPVTMILAFFYRQLPSQVHSFPPLFIYLGSSQNLPTFSNHFIQVAGRLAHVVMLLYHRDLPV